MDVNFKDKKGRDIVIQIGDDDIIAKHEEKTVARFDYWVTEVDYDYIYDLRNMWVDALFQKAGIGTEIIKQGEIHYVNVTYPHDTGDKNINHLSMEGGALISSCLRNKIISAEKYYGHEDEY